MFKLLKYLRKVPFKVKEYRKLLERREKDKMDFAVLAWLKAAANTGMGVKRVPVWRGQARGALQAVLLELRRRGAKTGRVSGFPVRPITSPNLVARGISLTDVSIDYKNLKFNFNTRVEYYRHNDENFVKWLKNPTPWLSMQAGEQAFKEALAEYDLNNPPPSLKDFIKFVVS